ncbi:Glutathione S-transferase kappa 1 [Ceratocystis fimbriata CBS 114723]|uniref:Glutathione S-transferase kappa 1 n=1 Tax=Ceratocystis fimbriata CBS 114723 TaxID=1035309 RepID=A0A2C5WUB9_9PEZI|nr:Glutathione S-transferase kappa 1 [Ceratocystis fimbriata CBS 114723]
MSQMVTKKLTTGKFFSGSSTDLMSIENNAPWINEAKGNYLKDDFRRSAERLGLPVNFPENFLTRANDLVPLQSLHVVKANYSPQVYHAAIGALFTAFWTPPNADINDVDVLKTALLTVEGLDEEKVQYILDAAVMPEFKQLMRQATETAVKQGAFGVPTLILFHSPRVRHISSISSRPICSNCSIVQPDVRSVI